jgi:WD40 repeat protein
LDGSKTTDQIQSGLGELLTKHPGIEEPLWQESLAARSKYLGTPQALRLGELLMRLPSPLDRLDQKKNEWLAVLDQEGPEVPKDRLEQLGMNPFGLDFSPDGKILAVTNTDNTVRLWHLNGPQPRKGALLAGHTAWVHAVAFSPDGKKLATGSRDKTVRLWDLATGKELRLLPDGNDVQALAFTADGNTLASGGGQHARLWDLTQERPQPVQVNSHWVRAVAFAPDGGTIAHAPGYYNVGFWDLTKHPPALLPEIGLYENPRAYPSSLAYSPDGKMLCVGLGDGWGVWDIPGKAPKKLVGPNAANTTVARVAFTPNGKSVVSLLVVDKVMVTDINNWKTETVQLPPGIGRPYSFALASDGRHVALGDNKRKVYILRLAPPPGKGDR